MNSMEMISTVLCRLGNQTWFDALKRHVGKHPPPIPYSTKSTFHRNNGKQIEVLDQGMESSRFVFVTNDYTLPNGKVLSQGHIILDLGKPDAQTEKKGKP